MGAGSAHRSDKRKLSEKFPAYRESLSQRKCQCFWFTNAAQGNRVIPPRVHSKSVAELGN